MPSSKTNDDARFSPKRCPSCGGTQTFQRRGVHFEHERYCGACQKSYDPEEEYQKWLAEQKDAAERAAKAEEERLRFNTHRE